MSDQYQIGGHKIRIADASPAVWPGDLVVTFADYDIPDFVSSDDYDVIVLRGNAYAKAFTTTTVTIDVEDSYDLAYIEILIRQKAPIGRTHIS